MNKIKLTKERLFNIITEVVKENSFTGGNSTAGATATPGTGEQTFTPKAFKKKKTESTSKKKYFVSDSEELGKESNWPEEVLSRHRDMKFIKQTIFQDGAKYQIVDLENNNKPIGTISFRSAETLKTFAMNYIKPQGGTQSTYLGEGSKIHIGIDTKTDSDIYFEPSTGAFSINVVDGAGNRVNKIQVNTIEDVLAKFPNWKWTEKGKAQFPEALDEAGINDPVLMAMRAKKDAPKSQVQKSNPNQGKINMLLRKRAEIERDMEQEAEPEGGPIADRYAEDLMRIDNALAKLKENIAGITQNKSLDQDAWDETVGYKSDLANDIYGLNENYSKFKTETRTRGKSEQFHQAVKGIRKKVDEISKLFEYCTRLQTELSEGEEPLKYSQRTEDLVGKVQNSLRDNLRRVSAVLKEGSIDEILTPDDYRKAVEILKQIENKSPKIYRAILDMVIDIYPHSSAEIDTLLKNSNTQLNENTN